MPEENQCGVCRFDDERGRFFLLGIKREGRKVEEARIHACIIYAVCGRNAAKITVLLSAARVRRLEIDGF